MSSSAGAPAPVPGRSDGPPAPSGRLGGARADFVASLGRKIHDARELLTALEDDPSSKTARDELRRRVHALSAGARLLRFDAMARTLQDALAVLDRGTQLGTLREQDVAFVAQALDDLPALAWGEIPPRETTPAPPATASAHAADAGDPGPPVEPAPERGATMPIAVLVVGGESLADALTDDTALHARTFECERTDEARNAIELARAYAPDLVLVDGDVPQAPELVEALLDDPLTEPVPIVVVGTFGAPEGAGAARAADNDAARFVALGVAKALPKPVAPEALRRACDEILDAREGRTMRVTLGEPTLEQLADRLAEELKRALVDSVDRPARSCRVPLGEGTEVLGALWGTIARVQEIVTQKTGGAIRFGGDAPEGAIALAPWLHQDLAAADRLATRGRGAAADVRLNGRRVVVADDDPGVTWFISDLLRTAGCEVHEALDGATALDLAFRVQPELVVSDILMPGMDGFALSRALRRDVALRDTPVILLSWKEDLLQRVRELGASAAAYMRKESDARAILARVREVLRPRARIEMRLRGDGEVRGRLDDLTPRLLLELVGAVRRDARVAVRDASHLYEIDIREGAPRRATRTASDGSFLSGERALAALLGVGAGRFLVASSREPVKGELSGTLFEQLARSIAQARGALAATTGARTMNVERILFDDGALEEYLRATPDPTRTILKRVARGSSPRQMLLAGEVSPSLLEDVLADLAARGAVRAVEGANGADFLTPAVDAALAVLRGAPKPARSVPPNARPSVPAPPVVVHARAASDAFAAEIKSPAPARPYETLALSEPPPAPGAAPDEGDGAPSSLEDAVMREISDRSPNPGAARMPTSNPPPIVEPSALRKRSSNPPSSEEAQAQAQPTEERHGLASIPPDAVVPGASSSEELPVASPALPAPGSAAEAAPEEHADAEVGTESEISVPVVVAGETPAPEAAEAAGGKDGEHDTDVDGAPVASPTGSTSTPTSTPTAAAPVPAPAAESAARSARGFVVAVLAFVVLGAAVFGGLHMASNDAADTAPAEPSAAVAAATAAPTAPVPAAPSSAPATSTSAPLAVPPRAASGTAAEPSPSADVPARRTTRVRSPQLP